MNRDEEIRRLIGARKTATLGTLHEGAPSVSMAPFAWHAASASFIVHVSRLAAHTNDMLSDSRVSLLICAPETDDLPAQALPRLAIQGLSTPIPATSELHGSCKAVYLTRFPAAKEIFQLSDFQLFGIVAQSVRYIAGFGQAYTLTAAAFSAAMDSSGAKSG